MRHLDGKSLRMHPNYERLSLLAHRSHAAGRSLAGITPQDVTLAHLYSYAFRMHVIGAFHATRVALDELHLHDAAGRLLVEQARESLSRLANRTMDAVAPDERALVSTFHFYQTEVDSAARWLHGLCDLSADPKVHVIRDRFVAHLEKITNGNGLYLTRDLEAPEQAGFVVPNLGITIVPLVYGDHHSWNLAWLDGPRSDVPYHLHQAGVEIHLGYGPLHGYTVLGDAKAEVKEGYAMPIPPQTRHGYTNIGSRTHHVPFIFGSLTHGGWGVFLDVEPTPMSLESLESRPFLSSDLNGSVYLEREIDKIAVRRHPVRYPIIRAQQTARGCVGGLELSLARITDRGTTFCFDQYCAVSVVRGSGTLSIAGEQSEIRHHDHFGIPARVPAEVMASGEESLVLLDAVLKSDP